MLKVQEYLVNNGLDSLISNYGIKVKKNEFDNRIILDYDQISSPKFNEIVEECRGLILEDGSYNLISKSFNRFYNLGEKPSSIINWDNDVIATTKEDGSMIQVYYWNGDFRVNTRFSWADSFINDSEWTWKGLASSLIDFSKLDKKVTYIFELCSVYNRIVRNYKTPQLYLLSTFMEEFETSWYWSVDEAGRIGIPHTDYFLCRSIDEVSSKLKEVSNGDITFEGFVIRDCHNQRLKIKSQDYVHLHRLADNARVSSTKNLVPLILKGETDEVLLHFDYLRPEIEKLQKSIDAAYEEMYNVWHEHKEIENQRDFAISIIKATRFTAPLFSAKKTGKEPKDWWTPEYVLKTVFGE